MYGHINLNVDISEFKDLQYNEATVAEQFHKEFLDAGHKEEQMILYNYFDPNPMPDVVEVVRNYFNFLNPVSMAVNLCKPGQYLPYHYDLYAKWTEVFDIKDVNRIHRYIVMLEDSEPGQMIQIQDAVYAKWRAGDYVEWTGKTYHAIYNMSTKNRYALQVTGYR